MARPYIGITDFTSPQQVDDMLKVLRDNRGLNWNRRLAVGVMMSFKTLNSEPTKWSAVFPKNDAIADIFVSDRDAFNVLHYADYGENPVRKNLLLAAQYGGRNLQAIQLDMVWPDPNQIQDFRWKHPKIQLILQVNQRALEVLDHDLHKVVARLQNYNKTIDYALLDMSMGKGKPMNADHLHRLAYTIAEHVPHLALAVAGGLGPETLQLADPLIMAFPDMSLDAQSKLRPSGNALDPIDWVMAGQYLENAAQRFSALIYANRF